ncbi:GNAT family N-acetyltransferase [Mucilaginibacter jinjuensis]|uniref:GNAT family N-acetyltransferase n=1 Tax=Mucilaginibacter jinjuensis TaxID=1176721 RepID=A0ABY7T9P0_9SPHI|nr:GNAT family N-acetyltransferase [Mucilaginibacter jinjuensis]WCT13205.1 GNAT family N-acetyltransferase [Mucilaginibacter jinjuensis]
MSISIATVTDTEELTALVNSAYRGESSKQGWTTESSLLDGNRIDDEFMLSYLQDENVTILKHVNDEELITGCVYLETKGDKLYLGMLTVSPVEQGKGIGKLLLAEADEYARDKNLEAITITVITTRHELIAWYERHGYQQTGELRPFHVDPRFGIPKAPIELLVMEKSIM